VIWWGQEDKFHRYYGEHVKRNVETRQQTLWYWLMHRHHYCDIQTAYHTHQYMVWVPLVANHFECHVNYYIVFYHDGVITIHSI
jgi:hypothetical protein